MWMCMHMWPCEHVHVHACTRAQPLQALLWDTDPPQHYAPPGGLISFDLDLPDELTTGFAPKAGSNLKHDDELVARHFRLMNHQLAQVAYFIYSVYHETPLRLTPTHRHMRRPHINTCT